MSDGLSNKSVAGPPSGGTPAPEPETGMANAVLMAIQVWRARHGDDPPPVVYDIVRSAYAILRASPAPPTDAPPPTNEQIERAFAEGFVAGRSKRTFRTSWQESAARAALRVGAPPEKDYAEFGPTMHPPGCPCSECAALRSVGASERPEPTDAHDLVAMALYDYAFDQLDAGQQVRCNELLDGLRAAHQGGDSE